MRKSTFNCVRDILKDYNDLPKYIKEREKELRNPYRETDLNADIKGTKARYDSGDNILITIEQDARLARMVEQYEIAKRLLSEADDDTRVIIEELYIRKRPRYTMQGLADKHLILCSSRTGRNLRTAFFEEMALALRLPL